MISFQDMPIPSNLEEYQNPLIYDQEYGSFEPDGPFYLNLAKKYKDSVLEIGCGTGRITIPIAHIGAKITGLDISAPMLEQATKKAKNLNIEWILKDCQDFSLKKKFSFIFMAGNAFQALLNLQAQEKFIKCVRHHLKTEGLFVFDTRNLFPEKFSSPPKEPEYWHSFKDQQGIKVDVYGWYTYNPLSQIATFYTIRKWPDHSQNTTISLKYTYLHELKALLSREGFEIINVFSYFKGQLWNHESERIVIISRLKGKIY
ncbi:MAG: class I SAM-dependent methyltransferase [Alphaproteobacteria bacterium]|nr:class I SAM-dependent methyltransferase [Alphaproteobacteria bacterium]